MANKSVNENASKGNGGNGMVDIVTQGQLLSLAMRNTQVRALMSVDLRQDDFVGPDRELYAAILADGYLNFDAAKFFASLTPSLKQRLDEIIKQRITEDPPDEVWVEWIKRIKELGDRRRMRERLMQAARKLEDGANTEEVYAEIVQPIQRPEVIKRLGDYKVELMSASERWKDGDHYIDVVPTGFVSIDNMIGGLTRQAVTILAARPGMGKTALAEQILVNTAQWAHKQGRKSAVVFFSAEMSPIQICFRLAQRRSGIPTERLRRGAATPEEYTKWYSAYEEVADNLNIYLDGSTFIATKQMLSRCGMVAAENPDGIDLVVFDYLELAADSGDREEARLGNILRGLKTIAGRYNCAVLVISQLNRECEQSSDKRPSIAHLRGSGWGENLAQTIMLLYRPDYYSIKTSTGRHYNTQEIAKLANTYGSDAALLSVAKNRDGRTGQVVLRFDPQLIRFTDDTEGKKA